MPMLDWNGYRQQVLSGVGALGKLSPDTVKGYVTLGGAGQKTGRLDAKTRELIALAVAISLRYPRVLDHYRIEAGESRTIEGRALRRCCPPFISKTKVCSSQPNGTYRSTSVQWSGPALSPYRYRSQHR